MDRSELLCKLQSVININGHILGVAMGNGMVARYAVQSQADLLLAMSAGRFRQMGQSAFSAFFGYTDTNRMIIDFATKEILPVAGNSPVICGIFMQDPTIRLYDFFKETKEYGFSGVINYPTVCCMDGNFRNALEQAGLGYDKEIEGIRLAHFLGLFTIAYVFDKEEAVEMAKAGADVICVHMGITGGGMLGATRVISMESAIEKAKDISDAITKINPQIIKTACSGPIQTPIEAQIFYKNTGFQGIFVGSAVERLPVEHAVLNTIKAFKSPGDFDEKNIISQVLNGQEKIRITLSLFKLTSKKIISVLFV